MKKKKHLQEKSKGVREECENSREFHREEERG